MFNKNKRTVVGRIIEDSMMGNDPWVIAKDHIKCGDVCIKVSWLEKDNMQVNGIPVALTKADKEAIWEQIEIRSAVKISWDLHPETPPGDE